MISNRRLTGRLVGIGFAMFLFGFALVPLYRIACELTGLNGATSNTREAAEAVIEAPDESRLVTVEFMVSLAPGVPVKFQPETVSMQVHPGKLYSTAYSAQNLTSDGMVVQASPSVSPAKASRHFRKTECFCFSHQPLAANEQKRMPVTFIVDPELPDFIDTVTLSYTFYQSAGPETASR